MDTTRLCVLVVVVLVLFFFSCALVVHSRLECSFATHSPILLTLRGFYVVHGLAMCIFAYVFISIDSPVALLASYQSDEKILDFEGCPNIECYFMRRIYRQYFGKSMLLMSGNCTQCVCLAADARTRKLYKVGGLLLLIRFTRLLNGMAMQKLHFMKSLCMDPTKRTDENQITSI